MCFGIYFKLLNEHRGIPINFLEIFQATYSYSITRKEKVYKCQTPFYCIFQKITVKLVKLLFVIISPSIVDYILTNKMALFILLLEIYSQTNNIFFQKNSLHILKHLYFVITCQIISFLKFYKCLLIKLHIHINLYS